MKTAKKILESYGHISDMGGFGWCVVNNKNKPIGGRYNYRDISSMIDDVMREMISAVCKIEARRNSENR